MQVMVNKILRNIRYYKRHSSTITEVKKFIDKMEDTALSKHSIAEDMYILKKMAESYYGQKAPDLEQGGEWHRTMFDMPTNMVDSTLFLALHKVTNKRLQNGWYKDKIVFLVNSEKSSSTLHEIIVRDILTGNSDIAFTPGIQRGLKYGPTEIASGASMHGLLPMYAPDGAVFRGPYLPTPGNFRYISDLGNNKIIFLCRHPADRLVASGCMLLNQAEAESFEKNLEDGNAFHDLINGYLGKFLNSLHNDLNWLAGWLLKYNDQENFRIFRYEDMVYEPKEHFSRLFDYLVSKEMDDENWKLIEEKMPQTKAGGKLQPGDTESRKYPRGYTGEVGIWKNYLNDKDVADYNRIVNNFINYHPGAEYVKKLYPDIILKK